MAVVLALVITGWLFAFAVGSRVGFDEASTVAAQPQKAVETASAQSSAYRAPASAS